MAYFKVDASEEVIKDFSGSSNYINTSGIYSVIVKSIIVETSKNGSEALTFWIDYNGQEQPIFQAIRMTNNDKSANLSQKMFSKLAIIAGADGGQDINDPVKRMIPIGEGGSEKECMVLADFDDTPLYIHVQMAYSLYDGKVQERKLVKNFFRFTDKATAAEIRNNKDHGEQFKKLEEESYATEIKYEDNLTEADIQEWKKNRSYKKDTTESKPKNGFGGNRFGKK